MRLKQRVRKTPPLIIQHRKPLRIRPQRAPRQIPPVPLAGRRPRRPAVPGRDARIVRRDRVGALLLGQEAEEALPLLRVEQRRGGDRRAGDDELGPPHGEDAAQHEGRHALGVGLRVEQAEGAAPGPAEDEVPPRDAEVRAQPLDVGAEVLRRVGAQLVARARLAHAALVEEHDAVHGGVEELGVGWGCVAARPAVEEDHCG